MAIYATVADFQARYGEPETLAISRLDNPDATTIDAALIKTRLQDASSLIEGYMPDGLLAPYPPILIMRTCEIARGLLDRYRRREDVQLDYEAALQWCIDVSKGLFKLPAIEPSQILPERGSAEVVEAYTVDTATTDDTSYYDGYRIPGGYARY
jgi:phage gp36-like protein